MRKIPSLTHILRLVSRDPRELPIVSKLTKSSLLADFVNKAHDLAEARKKAEEAAEEAPAEEEAPKPTTEELLAQILEELKKGKTE